jgi:phosphoribosylformimino-5-aminoimidazole carboxamide ribotide isomerase
VTGRPLLYPSIDLRGGRVVRLRQGDYGQETVYDRDPVDVAAEFCAAGATWIHVVDLDAARTGEARNRPTIAAIVAAVAGKARVQAGGGVRSVDDGKALAGAGVARAVMGSAAVADPALVERVAAQLAVAVGLDHRAGVVAVHGWTEASTLTLDKALGAFAAASAFVITDITRDGLLSGPDMDGLRAAVRATSTDVIASGGVASPDDVKQLAAIDGLAGIITGRALYEGHLTVAGALAAIAEVAEADRRGTP